MSYNSRTIQNPTTLESEKFVEIVGDSRFPSTSVVRVQYGESGMSPVTSVEVYPKYAVVTYMANTSDINVQLSASNVNIGDVGLIDHSTGTDVYAKITRTATVCGIEVGAVSVQTQNYPQLDALTAVDYATNSTVRSLTASTYATRSTGTTTVSGSVTVTNPTTAVGILNTVAVSGSVTILNPVSSVSLVNQLTAITVSNPVTAVNVLNTVAVSGNITATVDTTQGFPVTFAHTPNFDAFGRLRTSAPLTLFDSSHRYRDNNLWTTLTAAGGTYEFNQNQGLINMNVSTLSGSSVVRETTKVFAYQPGKSLLTLNTFVMAPSATNLRQRVGYFGADNGIYFQLSGGQISFVERTLVNGSPYTETIVPMSGWNGDKLDGTGTSRLTLDVTKSQIMWMDVEWLGMGTVRTGFIIDGQFVLCHSFHHANKISSTYITTASLPLRYEITNTGVIGGPRTMKQVCSTVISEGGYEFRGLQQAVGTPITTARSLTVAGAFVPLVTMRLKSNRLDAIVILTALSILPATNGRFYEWRVIASGTTSGGAAWVDAGIDSSVEYKLDATSITGGRILAGGYTQGSNQGAAGVDILKEALFKFQLERDGLTSTPYELSLVVAVDQATSAVYGSIDWEEVSR